MKAVEQLILWINVLSKIVDHYNSMKQIGSAKSDSSADKQCNGKDTKKKGYKSAVANLAIKEGAASSEQCQIYSLDHKIIDCPKLRAIQQEDAVRRG